MTDEMDTFTKNSVQLRLKNNIIVQAINENLRVCIKQDISLFDDYLELISHIQREFRGVGQFLDQLFRVKVKNAEPPTAQPREELVSPFLKKAKLGDTQGG